MIEAKKKTKNSTFMGKNAECFLDYFSELILKTVEI